MVGCHQTGLEAACPFGSLRPLVGRELRRAVEHEVSAVLAVHLVEGTAHLLFHALEPAVQALQFAFEVASGVGLSEAVQAAHEEGQEFGGSVARDAPALWLEAVLARKPRMPSDLEARLLQGSALPIDFLLHDEVRHALRRGFWDALERTRR